MLKDIRIAVRKEILLSCIHINLMSVLGTEPNRRVVSRGGSTGCIATIMSRDVTCDFETVRTIRREYFERRRRFPLGGVGACSPKKV